MFKQWNADLPLYLTFSIDDFYTYREEWLLYRGLGRLDELGKFIPPITYLEAQIIPKRKLYFFFAMDEMIFKLAAQKRGK